MVQAIDTRIEELNLIIAIEVNDKDEQSRRRKAQAQQQNRLLTTLSQALKAGDTIDMVGGILPSGHNVIVTVRGEYLNYPTMADLVEGQWQSSQLFLS